MKGYDTLGGTTDIVSETRKTGVPSVRGADEEYKAVFWERVAMNGQMMEINRN